VSKGTGWIAIDKMMAQEFKKIDRPFSKIEAMFSYSLDVNCGRKGSVSGYSKLWVWSRNKVRKFLSESLGEGHFIDNPGTPKGHPIHFIDVDLWETKDTDFKGMEGRTGKGQAEDRQGTGKGQAESNNDNGLDDTKDRQGTGKGQAEDRQEDTTSNPNPNPNIYCRVVDYLNRKTNASFKPETKKTKELISARVNEGFRADDFKTVIDFKCKQWGNDGERQEYLRPLTLFSNKFEGYLNAAKRENSDTPINKETPEEIRERLGLEA